MLPWGTERLQRRRLKCPACKRLNANNAILCEHCGRHIPDEAHHAQFIDDDNRPSNPRYLLIWAVALALLSLFFVKFY